LITPPDSTTHNTTLSLAQQPISIDLDAPAESICTITSPHYPAHCSTNNTTMMMNLTTTTMPTTDKNNDDNDLFAFFNLPATYDSAENSASTPTLD